jgi:hypothetical protein
MAVGLRTFFIASHGPHPHFIAYRGLDYGGSWYHSSTVLCACFRF